MRVAIDLRMVGKQMHGIARYAVELSRRLPVLSPADHYDLLVGPEFDPAHLGPALPNVSLVPTRTPFLSMAEQGELPLVLRRLAPDLYHSTSFSVPGAYRGPMILTIHDANHLAFPEHYGNFHRFYYKYLVRPGALRSRMVLTPSRFAQEEIETRLELPPGLVRVVYNGVDPSFRPQQKADIEVFRRRRGLPERFILYVGNPKPHKNVGQVLEAMRHLKNGLELVVCAGANAKAQLGRAAEDPRIHFQHGFPDAELPLLYAAARAFAFPSLYEGFGLPPLEAMACGTPVVATRAASLPEVLGEAADLVDPGDAVGLARTLERIDADAGHFQDLRARGMERAHRFSWDETAREVLGAYRLALEPFRARAAEAPEPAPAIPGPRGPSLKVLFCVRSDLAAQPGGDATQVLRTRDALAELGVDVTLWCQPHPPVNGSYDLAHLFHLTRLDSFVHARAVVGAGLPFVLSTIYWPTQEFEERGYVGALRLLHGALSTGPADVAKNSVRAILADGGWRWALLPEARLPFAERVEFLVRNAMTLLPNSQAEAQVLRGLGARKVTPIVNASDPPPAALGSLEPLPERFVLSVGRLEPRKNQLALVQALADFELPLILVGNPGPMHADYERRVRQAAGPKTMLLPGRSRERLFALYARAEAHIAPAWYETPGLVSLEAAAAGTRVVTTDRGSTREYFRDDATYLDPSDATSMRRAVEQALSRPRSDVLRQRVLREFTWQRAGEQTLEAYRAALATRPSAAEAG